MNRRGFLGLLGAAVAGIALQEATPLGRVWSFPSKIVIPDYSQSIRFIRAYDPSTNATIAIARFDVLTGFKLSDLPPELGIEWNADNNFLEGESWPTTADRLPS